MIPNSKKTLAGEILNIGPGGALLHLGGILAHIDLHMKIQIGQKTYAVDAQLLRSVPPPEGLSPGSCYAVQFSNTALNHDTIDGMLEEFKKNRRRGPASPEGK